MAEIKHDLLTFNRGVVSPKLLARVDVLAQYMPAEIQTNFVPSTLGPMSLRPGLEYIGATLNNAAAKHIPFVYSNSDKAIIEATDYALRVRLSGTVITRPSVSTAVTNSGFDTDLTGWTDDDDVGGTSSWLTGGYLSLLGDGTNAARRLQTLTVAGGDYGVEHALELHIARGPVTIRVGSSSGGDEYINETVLSTGYHSLAFTPSGASVYIQLFSREEYPTLVNSCAIAAAGAMVLTTPWPEAYLERLRYAQSADVIWVNCFGVRPQRIERRGTRSWSLVDYMYNDGPYRLENTTSTTLTPSALTGSITITASKPVFKSTHVGALFYIKSNGQYVSEAISSDNTFTDPILVTGTDKFRIFGLTVSGTFAGTVTLQRSVGAPGDWKDVVDYTDPQSTTLDDRLDNQVIYYRIGIKSGGYTSGTVNVDLSYDSGSIRGVAKVTAYSSSTSVTAVVLKDMGATTASDMWAEGAWSDYRGYPSSVALMDGRLWMAGLDKVAASVVDDYANHDPDYEGDAGPIYRTIGEGPLENIRWIVPGSGLIMGGDNGEFRCWASNNDDIITPTATTIRPVGYNGSSTTDCETHDGGILFVDASGVRVREMEATTDAIKINDLTVLSPEFCEAGIADLAVQRRPDTRVHVVLDDGTVAMLVYNKIEDVKAWIAIETDGTIEEVFTMPGAVEDEVYYVVNRTINSSTVRYLEKWALESECVGGLANKQADSFYYYNSTATTTISGLSHLEGETVVVWADGVDVGTKTVSSGAITLTTAASKVVVGLGYTAQYKSVRPVKTADQLVAKSRVTHLGLLLSNTHAQGIKFGPDFSTLDDMPGVEVGAAVDADGVWSSYNYDYIEFNGDYAIDSRICLQAAAPRPCTVLAAIAKIERSV